MTQRRVPPDEYPWWVRFALLGMRSRASQWLWVGISAAVGAVLLAALVFTDLGSRWKWTLLLGGVGGFVSAVLQWMVIRWVDRHGEWQ